MERKLVKQGRDALTVTLPSKWLKDKGLKAGNEVYIESKEDYLIINSKLQNNMLQTTLDIREDEPSMAWHKTLGKYVSGFDKITVLHSNPELVQRISQSLIGMIIEEHTSTRTVFKSIISVPENNIDIIIRRIFHMLEQQASLLEDVTKGVIKSTDIKVQEKLLDANIYYCLRYINKYNTQKDPYKYFLLCATIESAADTISAIGLDIGKNHKLATQIHETVKVYNKYFFSKDLKKIYTALRAFRSSIPKKTFVDGLAFELAEGLYDNIGYLMNEEESKK